MQERGVPVAHSTSRRWVLKYAPELGKRLRPHLKPPNAFGSIDQTMLNQTKLRGKVC